MTATSYNFRLDTEALACLKQAAAIAGLPVSDFIRRAAMAAAVETLGTHEGRVKATPENVAAIVKGRSLYLDPDTGNTCLYEGNVPVYDRHGFLLPQVTPAVTTPLPEPVDEYGMTAAERDAYEAKLADDEEAFQQWMRDNPQFTMPPDNVVAAEHKQAAKGTRDHDDEST
jgi:hypothetical protein